MRAPVLVLFATLVGCQSQITVPTVDEHTSRNSLDWAGTYQGVLPCADCEGIDTTLRLGADGTWQMTMTYLGESAPPVSKSGTFEWQRDGGRILLTPVDGTPLYYRVEENRLRALDTRGEPVTSALADNHLLWKVTEMGTSLENTHWKLVRLGTTAVTAADSQREPHIVLDPATQRVSGSGGCNRLMGGYRLEGSKLSFDRLAGTMMACVDGMELERSFHDALGEVATWRLDNGRLLLSDAGGTVVAEFESRSP